jgi:hypothetical protein
MLHNGKLMVCMALFCVSSAGAYAQSAPQNAGLPKLSAVQPLPEPGLVRNLELSVEQGYANAVNVNQPTRLDQKSWQTSVTLDADLGDWAFAGITGTYSKEDIASTNLAFALPIAGTARVLGVDGVIGIKPVEFIHIGLSAGFGSASASYQFTGLAIPATPGNSSTRRLGAFMSAFYGQDNLLLSATATVFDTRTSVDYGPGNNPQTDDFGATLLLGRLGAAYRLTDQFTVSGGLTFNTVLRQDIPAAQTGLDPFWLTLDAGAEYAITPQFSVNAKAATWLLNDRMTFNRFSVGASYSF